MLEKGSMYVSAELDLAEFKAKTDLRLMAHQEPIKALKQLGKEYRDQLKVSHEDIDGNEIITRPPAPKHGQVKMPQTPSTGSL